MGESIEKNGLLSSVSHAIRTELDTIVGLSEDIGGYENIPEEIREDAEDLITSSKNLFELIENILDFVTIEKGRMQIINAPYKPKNLFEELAKTDEELIGDKPIDLHTNIALDLPYELIGDKNNIEKITNNLLTNAIKYTDGGDIWFEIKAAIDGEDCNLIISVKDTGCGLKPEEIEKLLVEKENFKIERDTPIEGLGLGFLNTKSLVKMMNGTVAIESEYDEGSTFTVTIPQKINLMVESDLSRTQRLKLEQINYEEEGYGYKKILVVDDNELNIKVVRRILEQYDLWLDECNSGQECIDMISEDNDYDLILMDIMMPGMSGEETFKKLKEIEGFDIPVIALTADAEVGSQIKFVNEGFVDYIPKPFSKNEIIEKLDRVFKEKDLQEKTDE